MTQTTARFELPGFKGTLIHPGDDAYDDARKVFNGMIDRQPGAHRPLQLRRRRRRRGEPRARAGAAAAVYGGGHGVTGAAVCDAGVVRRPARHEGHRRRPRRASRCAPRRD